MLRDVAAIAIAVLPRCQRFDDADVDFFLLRAGAVFIRCAA